MKTPQIKSEESGPSPRDIKLSDGGEGVIVGKMVFKKGANGHMLKIGTLNDAGEVVPDKKKEKKK